MRSLFSKQISKQISTKLTNLVTYATLGRTTPQNPRPKAPRDPDAPILHGISKKRSKNESKRVPFPEKIRIVPDVVEYPKIKPQYPPGESWNGITEKIAWEISDERDKINAIPVVKERLEHISGAEDIPLHKVKSMSYHLDINELNYKAFLMKSKLINGLPSVYENINIDSYLSVCASLANSSINNHLTNRIHKKLHSELYEGISSQILNARFLVQGIFSEILPYLSAKIDYLRNAQFDKNVRLETFWRRDGFQNFSHVHGLKYGCPAFVTKDMADIQIRVEKPLNQFVSLNDDIFKEMKLEKFEYETNIFDCIQRIKDRYISVSGHWVGDPCEYGLLNVVVVPKIFDRLVSNSREKVNREENLDLIFSNLALSQCFSATCSQACNQGFHMYSEITYPFTAQCIVTDGLSIQFFAYQLNTLLLWKPDEANPKFNMLWSSPRYQLFEDLDKQRFNENALKLVLKFLLNEPNEKIENLRPLLPDESSPLTCCKFINHLNEPKIEHKKITQYQYPKNAVYF